MFKMKRESNIPDMNQSVPSLSVPSLGLIVIFDVRPDGVPYSMIIKTRPGLIRKSPRMIQKFEYTDINAGFNAYKNLKRLSGRRHIKIASIQAALA